MRIIHITALTLALAATACAKEKKDSTSAADPGATETATGSDDGVKAPKVAIGANRTESFADAKSIADTKEYAVSLALPASVAAGKEAVATVILTPKKGWKLNDEFPYSLKVEAPEGVAVAKASQDKSDAVKWVQKESAQWAVKFTADSAGTKSFSGDFNFAVCTDATCNPYQQKLAFAVDVK